MNDSSASDRPVARAVTAALLERYDRPAPRYTSYPTAVEFDELANEDVYPERLALANELADDPLSLYVHLPFCEEHCLFCGCHVIITPHKERAAPYLELLGREVELVAEHLPRRRGFSQLHLGGGTPTYYTPDQLTGMLRQLFTHFQPMEGAEMAVEVDPRVTTVEHVDALAELGFNRISLGVQDFTREVQEAVNRVQSIEETAELVEHAKKRGYGGINIDLIYGLPHQTPESFERTVQAVIEMGADRSAVYSFAYVPWIRGHQKTLDTETLPDRETKFALFATARERFLEAGYISIGMDHFAKPEDELSRARLEGRLRRNFQGYSVIPASDVIGLGISAIGDVRGAMLQNQKKLSTYGQAIEAGRLPAARGLMRTADDELRLDVIHALMCNFHVDVPAIEAAHGIEFASTFATEIGRLEQLAREGMVTIEKERIAATPTGELFIRNLALCFDRYFWERHASQEDSVFSRSV